MHQAERAPRSSAERLRDHRSRSEEEQGMEFQMLQLIFMRLFQDFNKKGRFVCNLFEPTCREKGFSLSPIRSQDKSHTKQPLLPHKTAVLNKA